jgi:RNA polymerase sigma-70 factor, ECF subfamily
MAPPEVSFLRRVILPGHRDAPLPCVDPDGAVLEIAAILSISGHRTAQGPSWALRRSVDEPPRAGCENRRVLVEAAPVVDLDELFRRVHNGDERAFRAVVGATSRALFRTAVRLVGSEAEAQEVVQDAYLRAFEALRDGGWQHGMRAHAWLLRIVTHGAIDVLRRRKVRPQPTPEVSPDAIAHDGGDAERHVRLRELFRWLDELAPDQRVAVVLRHLEGLSNADVARILQISEGAVEQRLLRAKAALRRKMDDERH